MVGYVGKTLWTCVSGYEYRTIMCKCGLVMCPAKCTQSQRGLCDPFFTSERHSRWLIPPAGMAGLALLHRIARGDQLSEALGLLTGARNSAVSQQQVAGLLTVVSGTCTANLAPSLN